MWIDSCIACGNCMDFIEEKKCPTDALFMDKYKGYSNAMIVQKKCTDCGKCKKEIDCLNDCFIEGKQTA